MSDLDLLRGVGDQLVPPPLDTLRQTARARDRRTAQAGIAVASVALLAVGATAFVTLGRNNAEPPPIEPLPTVTTPTATTPARVARPVTYADGATVHYGEQTVAAAGQVVELDLTDDGVVFRTSDNRIWFTDGGSADEIGAIGESAWGDVLWDNYVGRVVSGSSGSDVAWYEFAQPRRPWVVVYDTHSGEVVHRYPVEMPSGTVGGLYAVDAYTAYGFTDLTFGEGLWPNWRLDLATGNLGPNTLDAYQATLESQGMARTLEVSHEPGRNPGNFVPFDGIQEFAVTGGRIEPRGEEPLHVRDGLTGTELVFGAPAGYPDTDSLWLVEWLDDETVLLQAPHRNRIDLLECGITDGTCQLELSGPGSIVVPEVEPPFGAGPSSD